METALRAREESSALRTLQNPQGLDFCSNDYLGLARSALLGQEIDKIIGSLRQRFNGAGGSRLISGNSELAEELEHQIAVFHKGEAALLFSSGYAANLGLLSALSTRHDTVLYDEYVHASMRDGIRLGFSSAYSFRHNDLADLEKRLMRAAGPVFVVVESLYSMDGDFAPLGEISRLCEDFGAALIVDEAHANGLYGRSGAGLCEELDLGNKVFARVYTFGKALGVHGAAVVGSSMLRRYLINFARSFIYTTAQPPHALASIMGAYNMLPRLEKERERVYSYSALFDQCAQSSGVSQVISSPRSPIKSILVQGNAAVQSVSQELLAQGFDVRAIRSPAVPSGKERLRVCLHAHNTDSEIECFVSRCASALRKHG